MANLNVSVPQTFEEMHFIEDIGLFFEQMGMPRMAGDSRIRHSQERAQRYSINLQTIQVLCFDIRDEPRHCLAHRRRFIEAEDGRSDFASQVKEGPAGLVEAGLEF